MEKMEHGGEEARVAAPAAAAEGATVEMVEAARRSGLEIHNELRRLHGAEPLSLSDRLNESAQKLAEEMAANRKLSHSQQNEKTRVGENIAWARRLSTAGADVKYVIRTFYDEISDYSFANPGKARKGDKTIGHFTQIVWRRCFELGVGLALDRKHGVFMAFHYDPPGNCEGAYADNVYPVGSSPPPRPLTARVPELVLLRHNALRARHGVSPLSLNSFLSRAAQSWADSLAKSQDFLLNAGASFANNIAIVSEFCPERGVETWYEQAEHWDYNKPVFRADAAAFAQLVWKDTKRIGVGLGSGRPWTVLVVFYDPRGNDLAAPNAFTLNVLKPI